MNAPKSLPPPTDEERTQAGIAAAALLAAIANPETMGVKTVAHLDLARPRRGERWETWSNLPGFTRINGTRFTHALLPGWEYTRDEIRSELIPDLEALAARGERPKAATR